MSDTSQGEGWWLASDGKWYPPESSPAPAAPAAPVHGQPALGYAVVARPTANEAIWALVLGWIQVGLTVLVGGLFIILVIVGAANGNSN